MQNTSFAFCENAECTTILFVVPPMAEQNCPSCGRFGRFKDYQPGDPLSGEEVGPGPRPQEVGPAGFQAPTPDRRRFRYLGEDSNEAILEGYLEIPPGYDPPVSIKVPLTADLGSGYETLILVPTEGEDD